MPRKSAPSWGWADADNGRFLIENRHGLKKLRRFFCEQRMRFPFPISACHPRTIPTIYARNSRESPGCIGVKNKKRFYDGAVD